MFVRMFEGITGAKRGEQLSVFLSFLALFFLMSSYYLVKPLRDARIFLYFDTTNLAYFYMVTPIFSFSVTKFFSFWVGRIPRYRLMVITYGIVVACKLLFLVILPVTGRWTTAVFYIWVSVYFTLVLSILWAVFNTLFRSEQAERCFGFVALGATIGSILGSRVSAWLSESPFKDWALLLAALCMLAALVLTLWNVHQTESQREEPEAKEQVQHVNRGWEDVRQVVSNRYVRGIAIMVFGLAFVGSMVNLQVYPQIDRGIATQVYAQTYAKLDPQNQHFDLVFESKKLSDTERQKAFAKQWPEQNTERLVQEYARYKDVLDSQARHFFSIVNFYQGLLGVFLLVVVARFLFKFVGLRFTVLILPVAFFLASFLLMFPLQLMLLQTILIVGGALNYSLNNATKELLYTPTSEAVRFQQQPLIEGPVMRMGDVSASLLKILLSALPFALPAFLNGHLLLGSGMLICLIWMGLTWWTGQRYDRAQKAGESHQELDLYA